MTLWCDRSSREMGVDEVDGLGDDGRRIARAAQPFNGMQLGFATKPGGLTLGVVAMAELG